MWRGGNSGSGCEATWCVPAARDRAPLENTGASVPLVRAGVTALPQMKAGGGEYHTGRSGVNTEGILFSANCNFLQQCCFHPFWSASGAGGPA
ncbi:hypothetical protein AAFF_G00011870 [Aldrovandia affinis]|uniref:Uncharacterized protein n=1 Tax=Aldrovandia affinis TaxID=143900 RepID=A0AAD7S6K5_9TELE|nr:hypothetical protein AAFF_G00011870 [Aldrovandia affinis]